MVPIPAKYHAKVLNLLYSTWHTHRCCFKVSEAQKLTGKLARLAKGANWVFRLLSHLYSSIAYALYKNKRLLASHPISKILYSMQGPRPVNIIRHETGDKNDSPRILQVQHQYHYVCSDWILLREAKAGIWHQKMGDSLAHLIPRTPFTTTIGNSSLEGAGGFSIGLGFWWHVCFSDKIVKQTPRRPLNIYKWPVIINYIAALHVQRTMSDITDDPHPVILNITDNSLTLSWTLHTCKRSTIGCLLGRFFCSLLINSPLGINSQWISTINNKIADNISCLKKQHTDTTSAPHFYYTNLKQIYLEWTHCSFWWYGKLWCSRAGPVMTGYRP